MCLYVWIMFTVNVNHVQYWSILLWLIMRLYEYLNTQIIENCMAKNPSKPCFLAWNPVLFLPADRKVAFVKSFFFLGWGGVGCQRPWSQQLPTTLPTFLTSSLVWCGVGWNMNLYELIWIDSSHGKAHSNYIQGGAPPVIKLVYNPH